MAKAMDQEACWSCDHSGKPSTQWALIPGTQFGESTSREKRTQRHPYPPVRDLGGAPQGGWEHREGREAHLPVCTEAPQGRSAFCHVSAMGGCPTSYPHNSGAHPPAPNCNLVSKTQGFLQHAPPAVAAFPTPAVRPHLLTVGSDTWRLPTCTGLAFR